MVKSIQFMGIRCTSKIDAFKLHKHVQWKQLFLHEFYLKKENIAQRTFSLFPIRLSSSSRILWSCLFLLVKSFLKKRRKIINFRIVSVGRGIYANFTTLSMLNQMKFCSQSDSAHSLLRGGRKTVGCRWLQEGHLLHPPPPDQWCPCIVLTNTRVCNFVALTTCATTTTTRVPKSAAEFHAFMLDSRAYK